MWPGVCGKFTWQEEEQFTMADGYTLTTVPVALLGSWLPEWILKPSIELASNLGLQQLQCGLQLEVDRELKAKHTVQKRMKTHGDQITEGGDLVVIPVSSGPRGFICGKESARRKAQFAKHRSPVFTRNIVLSAREYFSSGKIQRMARVISDRDLVHFLLHGPAAYFVRHLTSPTATKPQFTYVLNLTALDHVPYSSSRYIEARLLYFKPDTLEFSCQMRTGERVNSSQVSCEAWNLAKLHICTSMQFHAIYLSHTWVHFIFPDICSVITDTMVPEKSEFYKFLEPHVKYNITTNRGGLSGFTTYGSDRTSFDESMFFSESMLAPTILFNEITERTVAFYYNQYGHSSADLMENQMVKDSEMGTWQSGINVKFGFPLQFNPDIPYTSKLAQLYHVFRDWVSLVVKQLSTSVTEKEYMDQWMYHVLKFFPQFKLEKDTADSLDVVDVLATFIFQVSVVHSLDHQHTVNFHALHQCASGARMPFAMRHAKTPLSNVFDPYDLTRAANFIRTVVQYVPADENDSFEALHYGFNAKSLQDAEPRFLAKLRSTLTRLFPDLHMRHISTSIAT